jgi:hypothetical protein
MSNSVTLNFSGFILLNERLSVNDEFEVFVRKGFKYLDINFWSTVPSNDSLSL